MTAGNAASDFWHSAWVASGGGPLLVLPDSLLVYWGGADSPDDAAIPRARESGSDYDRACQVCGHIGLLDVGPGTGLVLADEPTDTMWARRAGDPGAYLIRWIQAENDDAMFRALEGLTNLRWEPSAHALLVPQGDLVLFDSAMPGTDILTRHARINVKQGRYRISHGLLQPEPDTAAAVYLLAKDD
ncbi:MAG: hypothetical protein KA180_05195 [Gemmatimonadales bacterium]|nr:hypothetical protein [Gemmatimonadota bacterium]MBK7786650.1 hypothetical protein [Gemmatimonadota bacterium]MBP6668821.1 hypothetical protein [Gemmatimonadales bacterium]